MRYRPSLSMIVAALALAGCTDRGPSETHVVIIGEDEEAAAPFLAGATAQGLVAFDARGQIQPALAESWHVSDDGRSYIFRLARGNWPDGTPIVAEDVADALQFALADTPLADALGGVESVRAMTERVIEVRLVAPRPYLLPLLANPALAIRQDDTGSGPFLVEEDAQDDGGLLHLERVIRDRFGEEEGRERVHLDLAPAGAAIAAFVAGDAELVLGGDFSSLPLVREAAVPRGALRYDPVSGLFGLIPLTDRAPFDSPQARLILSRAIDRAALIEALGVPALAPRATILQDGLDLVRGPVQPEWLADPEAARGEAADQWAALVGDDADVTVRVWIPDGPGGDLLFDQISLDWRELGLVVERSERNVADFALVDAVAPSPSASWFLRRFSCSRARVCETGIDELVEEARNAQIVGQRQAILADAGARMDGAALFLPIAAPIRWSLVTPQVTGFTENRYAIHPLTGLKSPLPPETAR